MNNLDRIFSESSSTSQPSVNYAKHYAEYLTGVLKQLDFEAIGKFADLLMETRKAGKRIFLIGNGGSAATASHFANDLQIGPTHHTASSFKAIALTDNNAILTCIGNDFGYDEIFKRQLEVLLEPSDILIAISASGNSPNILKAVDYCQSKGNFVVGWTGFDGGKLAERANLKINIATPKGEYGPVEDMHMVLDHLVSTYLIRRIMTENPR